MMTWKGRVVYERIEHKFKVNDIRRIIRKTQLGDNYYMFGQILGLIIVSLWEDEKLKYKDFRDIILGLLDSFFEYIKEQLRVSLWNTILRRIFRDSEKPVTPWQPPI